MADDQMDPYRVLGIPYGTGGDAIRSAYRKRARDTHPDRAGGSQEEFLRVQNAYRALTGPDRQQKSAGPPGGFRQGPAAASRQTYQPYPPAGPPPAGPPPVPPQGPPPAGTAAKYTGGLSRRALAGMSCGAAVVAAAIGAAADAGPLWAAGTVFSAFCFSALATLGAIGLRAARSKPFTFLTVARHAGAAWVMANMWLLGTVMFLICYGLWCAARVAYRILFAPGRQQQHQAPMGGWRQWVPEAGQVWWAEVPFEEVADSKDRPVLVLSYDGAAGTVLMFTSQDQSGRSNYLYAPASEWNPGGKDGFLKLDRIITVGGAAFRRYGGTPSAGFTHLAANAAYTLRRQAPQWP